MGIFLYKKCKTFHFLASRNSSILANSIYFFETEEFLSQE